MASEDVIELGSSDEETEPAPKKRKPMPNAMVHIPNRLPGLSIKPSKAKHSINPLSLPKGALSKSITVTRVPPKNVVNTASKKKVPNGTPIKITPPKLPPPGKRKTTLVPARHNNLLLMNPIKVAPAAQVFVPSVSGRNKNVAIPSITKLPPGITVKRTSTMMPNQKRKVFVMSNNQLNKKPKVMTKKKPIIVSTSEVLTVDLDDDDSPSIAPASEGHQWYIRPEDQSKTDNDEAKKEKSIELEIPKDNLEEAKKNVEVQKDESEEAKNTSKEPEDKLETAGDKLEEPTDKSQTETNFIEITIEDSPVKPKNKRNEHVGDELAITIDDSPVKHTPKKKPQSSSDDETRHIPKKHPQSKKKLNYPKEIANTVEIEIDPIPVAQSSETTEQEKENNNEGQIIEIEESPLKTFETRDLKSSTPNKLVTLSKGKLKPQMKTTEIKTLSNEKGEFHPIYQKFIDLCFQLENSEDMNKIVEKKIKSYYRQVPKEYTESEAFLDMVSGKITAIKAGPEKMYLYIKDVVDELNLQRKMAKAQPEKDPAVEEQEKFLYGEDSEFDLKRQRQIRKLEKTLKKLHRAIQILEEQEVDFDDEDDSVYLLTERYKDRMVRVHAKFCQLTNTKMPSEPRVQIDPRPGQPKGPAKRLEKWINKKVPIGTPLPFPDFHDVLRCVRDANEEDKLGWNEADIMDEARDLFTRCGRKLQRRRQENEWRLAASRIATVVDPAEENEELKRKLENNRRVASVKESEVLNKFADRQNLLKLEAVEIGDKEADESPEESDEDEVGEETSLGNKEKRKERIKRLLQEKSRKVSKATVKEPDDAENKGASTSKDAVTDVQETEAEVIVNVASNQDKDPLAEANPPKEHDKPETDNENEIHSLSDDSKNLDSDVDELHLLQKLHSPNESESSLESSDSDSPIAISDTLSSGDNRKRDSDVISIENSSFSESEDKAEDKSNENKALSDINEETSKEETEHDKTPKSKDINEETSKVNETVHDETPVSKVAEEKSVINTDEVNQFENADVAAESQNEADTMNHYNTNDECNESIESILLASSDEEPESKDTEQTGNFDPESKQTDTITTLTIENETCINNMQKENSNTHHNNFNSKQLNKAVEEQCDTNYSPKIDNCINLRDEMISIEETLVEDKTCTANNLQVDDNTNIDENSSTKTVNSKETNHLVEANSLHVSKENDNFTLKDTETNDNNIIIDEKSDKIEDSSAKAMDFDVSNEGGDSNNPKDNTGNKIVDEKEKTITEAMDVDIAQGV